MNDVLILPGGGDRNVKALLEVAKDARLTDIVIVGRQPDGSFFMSSSSDQWKEITWLLWQANEFVLECRRG